MRSLSVDHLPEIALLIEKPHPYDRHSKIAGRFELVAGDIPEPSGINGQRLAQHVFHAKIRDAFQMRFRMFLLKPGGRFLCLAPRCSKAFTLLRKLESASLFNSWSLATDCNTTQGLFVTFQSNGSSVRHDIVGAVIPRPAQIQSQLRQIIETFDLRR